MAQSSSADTVVNQYAAIEVGIILSCSVAFVRPDVIHSICFECKSTKIIRNNQTIFEIKEFFVLLRILTNDMYGLWCLDVVSLYRKQ